MFVHCFPSIHKLSDKSSFSWRTRKEIRVFFNKNKHCASTNLIYIRDTQFVQTSFLLLVENVLVQSYGNILPFLLILVFVAWYIKKKLWLQAIVQHGESI